MTTKPKKGDVLWAIDPCKEFRVGPPRLTIARRYMVEGLNMWGELWVINDDGKEHFFSLSELSDTYFGKFFSTTPPETEKPTEIEMGGLEDITQLYAHDVDILGPEYAEKFNSNRRQRWAYEDYRAGWDAAIDLTRKWLAAQK
jgi:hypothetical protein